jgi:tRNA-splicing ligase RtcB
VKQITFSFYFLLKSDLIADLTVRNSAAIFMDKFQSNGNQKLRGKDLKKIGYLSEELKSLAINVMSTKYKYRTKVEKIALLEEVFYAPDKFLSHENLGVIAEQLVIKVEKEKYTAHRLKTIPTDYPVYGKKFIDQNTINQMDVAMQLPIALQGALMPDAHVGYGLPIGGVIATKNEVIPYAVGVDIGCRMSLSIVDVAPEILKRNAFQLKMALKDFTDFGIVKQSRERFDHAILDRKEFNEIELLRTLHGKAVNQLGTSGGGNHFVEFGRVDVHANNDLGIEKGQYVGLLSHSGSRGLGATIANYYKEVAMDVCRLERKAKQLAWLDMDKAEGMEYWIAMNLAGDYAKACHDVIHERILKSLGYNVLKRIENHHNFAWKELQEDGQELIVHRKGATPASKGELGIIPGNMVDPAFIVSGKGKEDALNSASHGAGRKWSRKKAKESMTKSAMRKDLKTAGVTLIGGGVDEAPNAYKDIKKVIEAQEDLVKIQGTFTPKLVRMCND